MKLTQTEIKKIKSLASKKGRTEHKQFSAEGIRLLEEAIKLKHYPNIIYYSPYLLSERGLKLVEKIKSRRITAKEVSSKQMTQISENKTSQGILALFSIEVQNENKLSSTNSRKILWCENISDPGNLGSLLRSALAFGFKLVVLSGSTADHFSPKVVRSSAGAIFGLTIFKNETAVILELIKKEKIVLVASDVSGDVNINMKNITDKKYILAVGSEASGLSLDLLKKADIRFKISHSPKIESLNAAVAGAIIMSNLSN